LTPVALERPAVRAVLGCLLAAGWLPLLFTIGASFESCDCEYVFRNPLEVSAIAFLWKYLFLGAFLVSLAAGSVIFRSPLRSSAWAAPLLALVVATAMGLLAHSIPHAEFPAQITARRLIVNFSMFGFCIGLGASKFAFMRRSLA
jgi:hypothetical protein